MYNCEHAELHVTVAGDIGKQGFWRDFGHYWECWFACHGHLASDQNGRTPNWKRRLPGQETDHKEQRNGT